MEATQIADVKQIRTPQGLQKCESNCERKLDVKLLAHCNLQNILSGSRSIIVISPVVECLLIVFYFLPYSMLRKFWFFLPAFLHQNESWPSYKSPSVGGGLAYGKASACSNGIKAFRMKQFFLFSQGKRVFSGNILQ